MIYTHNSDPQLYIDHRAKTNCGSFALNLCEWYEPEIEQTDYDYIYDWLYEMAEEGLLPVDVADRYVEFVFDSVQEEFNIEEAEYAFGEPVALEDRELVALRGYCGFDMDDINDIDWDFHFRVFRNGKWMEKNGCLEVHECDINDWGKYNSKTIYFYHNLNEGEEL